MILLDCDIASTLSKIDRLNLLRRAFPEDDIYITNSVYIELTRAKSIGFSFPDKIFESIPVISMEQKEREIFREITRKSFIHFGEAEGLSIAKSRGAKFFTNDSKVIHFCEETDISVISLLDFLYHIAMKRTVTLEEMMELIRDIEDKDCTIIRNKSFILNEYNETSFEEP